MKSAQIVAGGALSVAALLGAAAMKLAWNVTKRQNLHCAFVQGTVFPLEMFEYVALQLGTKYGEPVELSIHFLEMEWSSELELHPLADALTKRGHKISTIFESNPGRLETWKRVIAPCVPVQTTVLAATMSAALPEWMYSANGVAALARSADASLTGIDDGLAAAARKICNPADWSQAGAVDFIATICAAFGACSDFAQVVINKPN